ncbi:hypothetical protein EKG35_02145 [Lysinibacillus telephonicus]|uniref:S1 motif domain-containing protein n=1 Tax=Lysinibacillus telephonicus TaxID=1714840 RepID=A0A431UWZ5_9BACI|nr:hypothetical protein EKG35_02145 [Lysinibacillus telephonicus]
MLQEESDLAKKLSYIVCMLLLVVSTLSLPKAADAATIINGTFVGVDYTETVAKDGTVERKLSKITLENSSGRTSTFNIDNSAKLYINNTLTTIDGFKAGMKVQATVNLRKVKELRGTSEIEQGAISQNSKEKAGVVTKIDPNGMYISVKLDGGVETTYYINRNTNFIKGSSASRLSELYEGDRVKLRFSSASTSVVSEIEIIASGVAIENLYKGSIQLVNLSGNKLTVKNAQNFENWMFGTSNNSSLTTYTFTNNTDIYAGNKKISKNDLRQYRDSEVYFATVEQFGNEVIKKIIVLENYERSYYEDMTAVNTSFNFINLKTTGRIYFHEGTILVRNGRLVEPSTLTNAGTAYVVTDGVTKDNYAHVINITNDSMSSPNLVKDGLYFAELSYVDGYLAELQDVVHLDNNYWKSTNDLTLSFSNSTNAEVNYNNSTIRIIPNMDLIAYETYYGYFYVQDGHIQAIHLLKSSTKMANQVLTGVIENVNASREEIDVKNVSQWFNGTWLDSGSLNNVELEQTLIIKDGKVIEPSQLKQSDRVVLFTNNSFNTHVLLVN